MAVTTSLMIPSEGLIREPLRGHSKNQFLPMCQIL